MLKYKQIEALKEGATLDTNLKPVAFKQGYQVAITNNISAEATIQIELGRAADVAKSLLETTGRKHYVGVWHDEGKWYIDVSLYIDERESAMNVGKLYQQQAVYDWGNRECLTVE